MARPTEHVDSEQRACGWLQGGGITPAANRCEAKKHISISTLNYILNENLVSYSFLIYLKNTVQK